MRRAFTLIEVMVTLGLVALVAGLGMRFSVRSTEQKRITEAAQTIRQYYSQAKSLAQAGRKDCGLCGAAGGVCGNGDNPLLGWRITLNTTVTPVTYELHGECAISALPTPTPFFSTGTKTLPNSVTVTVTGSGSNVLFYPLNKGTNMSSASTLSVSSTMTGLTTKSFNISAQGEISAVQ
jgi:prepilin-type N-terminal cleavage/methylation domain-containing protein